CVCSDGRYIAHRWRWQCSWHAVWCLNRGHDYIYPPIQWHIELVVDPYRSGRPDTDLYWDSKSVLCKKKTLLNELARAKAGHARRTRCDVGYARSSYSPNLLKNSLR